MLGRSSARVVVFLAAVALFTCGLLFGGEAGGARPAAAAVEFPVIALGTPTSGFSQPVVITHAGDGSLRLFVVEQGGRIRLLKNGVLQTAPFLDISARISTGGERGLLGLAFPPGYATKGHFYVNYTNTAGNTVISRFRRSAANPDAADPASEQILLTVAQPFPNHNGGQLAFGPADGYLYVGLGDGGSGGDPGNRAQNPNELLGKILRLDVESAGTAPYAVPPSNPFVGRAGHRPEVWALGLRNPWRFSFDRLTGDLFVADVGQNVWEEVNFQPASSQGGENYGWRIMEGSHCFNPSTNCPTAGLTLPVAEYAHSLGCSITGGYVSRSASSPRLEGFYFYGDFCTGRIWALKSDGATWESRELLDTTLSISTFGEDEAGNIYVADYAGGTIRRIVDVTPAPTPTPTPTPAASFQFTSAQFSVTEDCTAVAVTVQRAPASNTTASVDFTITDGTAKQLGDYTTVSGRLIFQPGETTKTFSVPVSEDTFVEGQESATLTLSNPSTGAGLGAQSTAALVINDDDTGGGAGNPLNDPATFVCQHYHDFLSRHPDPAGLAFWANQITECGASAGCTEVRRINVSAAFFLSIEFQQTGFLVYRAHRTGLGAVPVYQVLMREAQEVGRGVIVGEGNWSETLAANQAAYLEAFVIRPEFLARYPATQTPEQYIDSLNTQAGTPLSQAERDQLVNGLRGGQETRATVFGKVLADADYVRGVKNQAFVLMEYYGYLRRDADEAGYNFWLTKLNDHGGDYVAAEMVKAFITSPEYLGRFGQ